MLELRTSNRNKDRQKIVGGDKDMHIFTLDTNRAINMKKQTKGMYTGIWEHGRGIIFVKILCRHVIIN